jgi:hypothetical protein
MLGNRTAPFAQFTLCWHICALRKLVGEIDYVAALVLDMFCHKIKKIANNSATTKGREKMLIWNIKIVCCRFH